MSQILSDNYSSDMDSSPIIQVKNLTVRFRKKLKTEGFFQRGRAQTNLAVNNVSLDLFRSEILSVVGETGSGKTTLAKCISAAQRPSAGSIRYNNREVRELKGKDRFDYDRAVQMIYQDPYGSLNPGWDVYSTLSIPLTRHAGKKGKAELLESISRLLREVGLDSNDVIHKFPHQMSGGERQRVNIARALASEPEVLIADEPITMLDASQRLNILSLLNRLKEDRKIAILFITHDLASAKMMSGRMAVMYLGRIVEYGRTETILSEPSHPYTSLILSSAPSLAQHRTESEEESDAAGLEDSAIVESGCVFRPRCRFSTSICDHVEPKLEEKSKDCFAACHNALNVSMIERS
jgi:peptide/nickel transport system ATP-binding protein